MKTKYHTVGTSSKSNRKILETETKWILPVNIYMTDHHPGWISGYCQ